jgi:hypothetical protein
MQENPDGGDHVNGPDTGNADGVQRGGADDVPLRGVQVDGHGDDHLASAAPILVLSPRTDARWQVRV